MTDDQTVHDRHARRDSKRKEAKRQLKLQLCFPLLSLVLQRKPLSSHAEIKALQRLQDISVWKASVLQLLVVATLARVAVARAAVAGCAKLGRSVAHADVLDTIGQSWRANVEAFNLQCLQVKTQLVHR